MNALPIGDSREFDARTNGHVSHPTLANRVNTSGNRPTSPIVIAPTHSSDAERSLLACMMTDAAGADNGLKLIDSIQFESKDHQAVFRVIRDQRKANFQADIGTVVSELANRRIKSNVDEAMLFLSEILKSPHQPEQIAAYARIIREKAERRTAQDALRTVVAKLDDPSMDTAKLLDQATQAIQTFKNGASKKAKPRFSIMTSAELDAADLNVEYLCEEIVAKLQPCVIAASKKSLKTTIAIDLTLSFASGLKFVNQFNVPKAVRVALMSGESGNAVIQETARRIAKSKPLAKLSDYENAIWSFDLPKIGQPKSKQELTNFIKEHRLEALIIDPAYLCMDLGDKASNLFAVGKQLIELTEIMSETACTIIIVHHCKKTNQNPFAAPELEDIAWAGFQEWARQWILLGRREAYQPEAAGTHKLWLSVGGSAGHSGLWALDVEEGRRNDRGGRHWDVSIASASVAIADAAAERKETKAVLQEKATQEKIKKNSATLLDIYRRYPDGETGNVLKGVAGLSGTDFLRANDSLRKNGLLESCSVMKSGRNHDAFRLKNSIRTTRTASGLDSDCPSASDSQTPPGQTLPLGELSGCVCDPISNENENREPEEVPLH